MLNFTVLTSFPLFKSLSLHPAGLGEQTENVEYKIDLVQKTPVLFKGVLKKKKKLQKIVVVERHSKRIIDLGQKR